MDMIFTRGVSNIEHSMRICIAVTLLLLAATAAMSQDKCITPDRVATLLSQIKDISNVQANDAVKTEILAIKKEMSAEAVESVTEKSGRNTGSKAPEKSVDTATAAAKRKETVCQILNSSPWPGKSLVGDEAASAWISLVKTYLSVPQQLDLMPVIAAGLNNGEIAKDNDLAAFVDRLRIRLGQPQLFGTQMTEKNGFIVLYPLQSEESVDAFRKEYGMDPIKDHLRAIQNVYKKLIVRSTAKVKRVPVANASTAAPSSTSELINKDADNDVVKVDTSIVTIDATVSGTTVPTLGKGDFKIYEDGQEQEITAFEASESPFDIVLLLDLSGSTSDKIGLIKKTTKHFIETKRDADRVAIVTFNSGQNVVSPLQADKTKLLADISHIKGNGASQVWDSEKFAMDLLKRDSPAGRRKAVVVMTDGIDNDLYFTPGLGSSILFADLVEEIRNNQISIFPIYLSPSGPDSQNGQLAQDARRTMQLIADESGGTLYTTANLDSLNEVYEHVLQDVGRVYSLGYEPKNDKRDGTWRSIRVEVPTHPDLKLRARSGYYAK
jgi:Ca-activated chloride channel family protein